MGLIGLLVTIVQVLGVAAVKYLFFTKRREQEHYRIRSPSWPRVSGTSASA
jgi:hypothetical protein